jgi:NitT/TauT family transport system substrate-binding protein
MVRFPSFRSRSASVLLCSAWAILSGTAAAQAADQVRVGLAAIYPPYGVTYVAQELGFYKENDLDVQITNFASGPVAQEALAAGAIDVITISPPGAGVAIGKGVKEKIVAPTGDLTPEGWHIVVPAASAIKTLKDLEGKTVGISSKASTTDFLALWAARKAGITFKTVPLGTPGVLPALKNKQIDAAVLWPLVSYKNLLDNEYRSLVDFGREMEPVLPDTWSFRTEIIDNKPDVIRRWLSANSRAIVYMQAHEAWTIDFLKRYTKENDERVLKMTFDTIIKGLRPDGRMEPAWMTNSLALATDTGLTLPPLKDIFAEGFTPIVY